VQVHTASKILGICSTARVARDLTPRVGETGRDDDRAIPFLIGSIAHWNAPRCPAASRLCAVSGCVASARGRAIARCTAGSRADRSIGALSYPLGGLEERMVKRGEQIRAASSAGSVEGGKGGMTNASRF